MINILPVILHFCFLWTILLIQSKKWRGEIQHCNSFSIPFLLIALCSDIVQDSSIKKSQIKQWATTLHLLLLPNCMAGQKSCYSTSDCSGPLQDLDSTNLLGSLQHSIFSATMILRTVPGQQEGLHKPLRQQKAEHVFSCSCSLMVKKNLKQNAFQRIVQVGQYTVELSKSAQ